MELLRVTFPVSGSEIPLDHGYAVFSAVSQIVPEIHANRVVAIAPIRGVFPRQSLWFSHRTRD